MQQSDTPSKFGGSEYSEEELKQYSAMYERSMSTLSPGEIVKGKIVRINESTVTVDIGFKSEGQVPITDFHNSQDLKIGDEIEVYLESVENKDGELVLSRKRAEFMRTWERVVRAHDKQEILHGKILRRTKGGLVVDLLGMDAFLPGSQIDVRPVRDFDAYLGREMEFRVVKVNHPSENVVISHKVLVEEALAEQRKGILEKLEKGQILEGHVKAITDFGAFIDLGGVDGLVHITDLSWGRINHPSEAVKLDQLVNVVVLDYDAEKKRISLGMKQLQPHPWENIENRYPVGTRITGKIVSLTEYGAFVEIQKGIEGLIHISEMSWTKHITHPSQMVSLGQTLDAVILSLDKDGKKISLGMKQLEPDPWKVILEKYPVSSRHSGTVRNLTNFGIFVELEEGIDGLVHISDLSWTKKIRHPGEVVKKGERIDVMILNIDVDQRRISLGHKQLLENPWDAFEDSYRNGNDTEGSVIRLTDKGVVVELPHGVEGFVPTQHLSDKALKNIQESFKVGDKLSLRVIEFDKESKKIVLSALEYLRGKEQKEVDDYLADHKLSPTTLKDLLTSAEQAQTERKDPESTPD